MTEQRLRRYLDLIARADEGAVVNKRDWDFEHVLMTVRRLVKKYELGWDKQLIIPSEPDVADRIFQAGMELAQSIGVFLISSGRILRFDRAELEEGVRQAPQTLLMGEGKDARTLIARRILDPRPPLVWAGNPGVPTPEGLFLPMVMSWMQEPIVDLATCGSLPEVDGHPVRTGEAGEIAATRRELHYLREGLRRVGRDGMGLLAAQSSVSELGDLAVAHPDYLRPCDAHLVPMLNELTMDKHNITRVVNSIEYGMRNASLATAMIGGLGGDAPGAAIVQTASFMAANLVCLADYHLLHPIHIRHVATTTRGVLWVQSVVQQAFARNAPCIIVSDIYPKSGALTTELLYETAANAIVITACGGHLEGVGAADGAVPNGTGLEARLMGEVGHAVVRQKMDLAQANEMVLRQWGKYEHVFKLEGGNPGVRFDQAYDLESLQPVEAWHRMYVEVKNDLRSMGLTALE
ncbi:MAG: monomethylamine:corrinoid methyltransferase [Anaerolineaceae bacterium]|nr:monomethylamine:corrinoid methyltransferase [Anaerolineaceae bacterium]